MSFFAGTRSFSLLALGSVLTLAACGGDEATSPDPAASGSSSGSPNASSSSGAPGSSSGTNAGGAQVRVVHASPDAPAVDVYVKGQAEPVVKGLHYTQTSAYLTVPAGTYELEIRASPSTSADPVAFATGAIALTDGEKLSAVAAGLLGSAADAARFRVLGIEEGFGIAAADSALVRVVHASPDAPSVGIDLHDDNAAAPEVSNIDRFGSSAAEGILLSAGQALQLGITAGGQKVTAFTTPSLPAGGQLLVIATGLVGKKASAADGFGLLAVGPEGTIGLIRQNPRVYALHAGADAPAVDLFVGPTELASLSFGQLSAPVQVPPGSYDVDFFPAAPGTARPAGAPAVTAATGALEAGNDVLAVATGLLGAGSFRLVAANEAFAADTQARLRVIHAAADAPAVDVGVLNAEHVVNPVLFSNVTFGNATAPDGLGAGAGTLALGVTPTGQGASVVAAFHVPVVATTRAFAVAAGTLATAGAQPFQLLAVSTETSPWQVTAIHPQP